VYGLSAGRRSPGVPAWGGARGGGHPRGTRRRARWQGRAYAFSIKCPHRGTRLEWHADETRIFCPKYKARFRPDGAHVSGRTSRDLDRYDVRRQGSDLLVNFDALRRADTDAAAWSAAVVQVG
jgi:nitrite reductase/ring-hydroxylating ferredoxin subunit